MDPILEPIIKSFLGQMDSAMKISELLADHSNSEEITVDHIVIGLIYRLMTPMTDDEITSALSNAEQMLENMDNSDDEDYDDIDECYENIKLGRNIQHPICNCSICMKARICLLNYKNYECSDPLSEKFNNAIKSTCEKHKIFI